MYVIPPTHFRTRQTYRHTEISIEHAVGARFARPISEGKELGQGLGQGLGARAKTVHYQVNFMSNNISVGCLPAQRSHKEKCCRQ